ncbi:MAG: helix-turn-helix domain-containing protein [Massilia sp.]|nr:helix-turn-helix domain-containing protein [Massilia sp.]
MSSERAEPPAKADNHGVPGRILAAQREAMAWSVEQVADQLKLAVRQVVALEAGDYAKLPGPAVVRGFVRAYAKIVKLDPMPLVAMISIDSLGMGDAIGSTVRRERPAAFSEVRFSSRGNRPALPLVPIAVAVVVIVAAVAAWNFGLVSRLLTRAEAPASAALTPSLTPNLTPTPSATTSTQGTAAPDATAQQNASVPLISVPPPSVSAAGSPAAGGAQVQGVGPAVPAPVTVPAAVPAVAPANALVITVREDSWIELKRAKGAPLIARVLKAGSTESFDVTEPVTLVVGKPGAVAVTLRGAPLELPGAAVGAVSRLNLK